jgi:hypothetical protein
VFRLFRVFRVLSLTSVEGPPKMSRYKFKESK